MFVWLMDCTGLGFEVARRRLRQVTIRIMVRRRDTTAAETIPAMTAGLNEDDTKLEVSLNGVIGVG